MLSSLGMEDLLARVRRYASRYGLLTAGGTVVVGVSGGPDSLALLHLLRRLSPELGLSLHVAHLNHSLRGSMADEDAQFVAGLAERWGLPYTLGHVDVRSLAAGRSLEEAARQARYRFLAEAARGTGAAEDAAPLAGSAGRTIAVGHNADDQAETVLMHFLRGAGVAGLRGMLPRTALGDYRLGLPGEGQLWLVRPLLGTPRRDIEVYCAENDLEPRFDRSNEDVTFYRNRLRHELLPLLEGYNPAIRKLLAHTAAVMAGDGEILRTSLEAAWRQVIMSADPGEVLLDLPKWRELKLGLQRATLREAIHILRHELRDINWEHVERAVWLAREGRTGQSATLSGGLVLQIGYCSLRVAEEFRAAKSRGVGGAKSRGVGGAKSRGVGGGEPRTLEEQLLSAPGVTRLDGGWRVIVRLEEGFHPRSPTVAGADGASGVAMESRAPESRALGGVGGVGGRERRWEAWLDAEVVGTSPVLRPRRPGDRFQPRGLGGHSMKLNEFMINEKVPRDARAGWPLLEGAYGLAWVCGLRVDERAAARPESQRVWHVRFVRDIEASDEQQTSVFLAGSGS